jgi:hypothetical protein
MYLASAKPGIAMEAVFINHCSSSKDIGLILATLSKQMPALSASANNSS